MAFYVYIMASRPNGTLYIGSTDNLRKRGIEHKEGSRGGFTARYGVNRLVWLQSFETRAGAFKRERQLKEWQREWKIELIERKNPHWRDLYDDLNNLLPF